MDHDKPRLLDLFSGIAGFSLGLEAAGFETVAFCEQSKPCQHLLAHHYPGVPIYDDVTTLTAERLSLDGVRVDAICGGFPCQDVSEAGRRVGLSGARSGLWGEYDRLIGELRPRVVFVENVSGLLSGRGIGVVLGDLATRGYNAWWDCLPASAFGLPHERDRVWIVAYRREVGWDWAGFYNVLRLGVRSDAEWENPACGEIGNLVPWLKSDRAAHLWQEADAAPGGVDDGFSRGLDSEAIGALGNAVVPAIPALLGQAVMAAISWS